MKKDEVLKDIDKLMDADLRDTLRGFVSQVFDNFEKRACSGCRFNCNDMICGGGVMRPDDKPFYCSLWEQK